MKNKSSELGADQTVLEVVSVCASSGTHRETSDDKTFKVLQDAGFTGLKYSGHKTTARPPGGDTIFLLDYDASSRANQKPFRLVRLDSHACKEVETGYTIYIQNIVGSNGSIEVFLKGDRLSEWTITAKAADAKTAGSYKQVVTNNGIVKPREVVEEESDRTATPVEEDEKVSNSSSPNGIAGEVVLKIPLDQCVCFQKQESDPSFSGQPRKYFDEVELQKLVGSIRKKGQKVPALVRRIDSIPGKKWEIIAGERRWRALQIIGFPYLRAIEETPESKKEQHMLSLIENLFRVDPSALELSDALQEQIEAGETQISLAEATSVSLTQVRKLLAIQSVHPNLKVLLGPEVAEENRIRLDEAAILGKIHPDHQEEIWNQAKDQPSRRLIVAKLHQLGRSLFQNKRTPRADRRNNTYEISVRTNRRLNALNLALIELKAVTPEEWREFAALRGVEEVSMDMTRLTEATREIEEIKQRISRAKIAARSSVPNANQSTGQEP